MGWNGTMSLPQRTSSEGQRLIIHHLSDLHFKPDPQSSEHMALINYAGYLNGLPIEKRPNLVVITGDLTHTGEMNDLRTVATILRTDFPSWVNQLAQRIFVVPGPRDVNWEGAGVPSFDTFYDVFADFGLPTRAHGMPHAIGTPIGGLPFVAYPIDTCYTPESLPEQIRNELHAHGDRYQEFKRQYRDLRGRPANSGVFPWQRAGDRRNLREGYLDLTEDNPVTVLDAGIIDPDDLEAFKAWAGTLGRAVEAEAAWDPLKILITHHPLQVYPQAVSGNARPGRAIPDIKRHFGEMVSAARNTGFHLALHGHMHKPQVLSDLSVLEGADTLHPLRQIGAGSLGDHGIFNEIRAVYLADDNQRHWWLEIRTVNVLAENPDASSFLLLLNPPEDAEKRADQLEQQAIQHREFDNRVRWATRQFSETVMRSRADTARQDTQMTLLPQNAIQTIEGIIRDVIFEDYDIRVRLLLKDTTRPLPRLVATYLVPPPSSGAVGPLVYPASVAAWALILGRSLISPNIVEQQLTEQDYDWLRRSGKVPLLQEQLRQLTAQAMSASLPDTKVLDHYAGLQGKLEHLGEEPRLRGTDFYQEPSRGGQQRSHSIFISVPIPLRPAGDALPELPEIGVLDVRVLSRRRPNAEPLAVDEITEVFTADRVQMLESLSEVIAAILCTSSALGKPRGVWEERFVN
jgi:3',5'-cyclic AMP phosphodiesterase CpdA